MNIQELCAQKNGMSLGPVTVTKAFPKSGTGEKSNLYLVVQDGTGTIGLKLWGAASNSSVSAGSTITINGIPPKGGITLTEWNGKEYLNANNCRIEIGGSPDRDAVRANSSGNATVGTFVSEKKVPYTYEEIVRHGMRNKMIAYEFIISKGYPHDVAVKWADTADRIEPMSFFGEKTFGVNGKP